MSNPEGKLHFTLQWRGDGVAAGIQSTRPVQACRVFEQLSVDDTLKRLPLLFNVCGQAQSIASIRAVESVDENFATDEIEQQRQLLLTFESLREHLWRMLVDWPILCGKKPSFELLSPLHQQLLALQIQINPHGELTQRPGRRDAATELASLMTPWQRICAEIEQIVGANPMSAAERLLEPLQHQTLSALGDQCLDKLPEMPTLELAEAFQRAEDFIALPEWSGRLFETGPYARQRNHPYLIQAREQHGHGVYTRLIARIVETSHLLELISEFLQGHTRFDIQRAEQGIAQVEAVRGRLVHAVELKGDKIRHYRILAPTEWNFHPQGIAMQMLSSLDEPERLKAQAAWVIQAIDPCVGYEITVLDET